MKKYLFASAVMALAACSNEELWLSPEKNANGLGEGIKVTLTTEKGVQTEETRVGWTGADASWTSADQLSVFYLGKNAEDATKVDANTVLQQKFNSVFETSDGASFSSKSLVYLGGNVVVAPAQLDVCDAGEIELSIADHDPAKIPFYSNYIYVQKGKKSDNVPGYNQGLYAPMKQAAQKVELTLNVQNEPKVGDGLIIKNVEFITPSGEPFATSVNLVAVDKTPATTKKADGSISTITQVLQVKKSEGTNTLTSKQHKDRTYYFTVFPTGGTVTDFDDVMIKVNTNMGHVDIKTSDVKYGEKKDGVVPVTESPLHKGAEAIGIKEFFFDLLTKFTTPDKGTFKGENLCGRWARTLNVDMSKANLDGCEVESSEEIANYIELYKAMKKEDLMKLKMKATFKGFTKDIVESLNKDYVGKITLDASSVTSIDLLSGGDVVLPKKGILVNATGVDLTKMAYNLTGADNKWTLDQSDALAISTLTNKGCDLTITDKVTGDKHKEYLDFPLVNDGKGTITVSAGSDVELGELTNNADATINVPAGSALGLLVKAVNYGTIKVLGTMNTQNDGVLTNETTGVIENSGFIASQAAGGSNAIYNFGTIKLMSEDAVTLLTANSNLDNTNGISKTSKLDTNDNKNKNWYTYKCLDGTYATDATNSGYEPFKPTAVKMGTIELHNNTTENLVIAGDEQLQYTYGYIKYDFTKDDAVPFDNRKKYMNYAVVNGTKSLNLESIKYVDIKSNATIKYSTTQEIVTLKKNVIITIPENITWTVKHLIMEEGAKINVAGTLNYGCDKQQTNIYGTSPSANVSYKVIY